MTLREEAMALLKERRKNPIDTHSIDFEGCSLSFVNPYYLDPNAESPPPPPDPPADYARRLTLCPIRSRDRAGRSGPATGTP